MTILPSAQQIARGHRRGSLARHAAELSPIQAIAAFMRAADFLKKSRAADDPTAVASTIPICGSAFRFHWLRLFEPFPPRAAVVSLREIPGGLSVQSIGVIR